MKGPIRFVPFNRNEAAFAYRNNLPHWRQPGATYFVTYRLADSIPHSVLARWEEEKREWLRVRHEIEMDRAGAWKLEFERLPWNDQEAFRRAFARKVNECLDRGLGSCVLGDPDCGRIVERVALTFDGERYDLGDLVVMPNHVHMLVKPHPGHRLERILQGM